MKREELLAKLIADRFGGNQAELARAIGRAPTQIWQYLNGRRELGEAMARHIETRLRLPRGWFDHGVELPVLAHASAAATALAPRAKARIVSAAADQNGQYLNREPDEVSPGPKIRGQVPLISWVRAGDPADTFDPYAAGIAEEWVETTVQVRAHTYALRVEGDSMAPLFPPGSILVVEPDMHPIAGHYVIARNGDGEVTFKQLVKDGGDWYLKPLNERYPLKPLGSTTIIGVVRETINRFC